MTPQNISVTQPVNLALERTKQILFQPFDLGKWLTIGFCAWLALLGGNGVNGGFHVPGRSGGGPASLRQAFDQARDYVLQHLWWILPVAIGGLVIGLAIWVFIVWVSSRGQFMFLHCVASNRAEVQVPWNKFARESNSLFVFRLVLGLGGLILMAIVAAAAAFPVIGMLNNQTMSLPAILGVVAAGLMALLVGVSWGLVGKLTRDFVVPIQFARGSLCLDAWRVLIDLLSANIGEFVVYLLFQVLLWIVIYVAVVAVVLLTCCIAGCLLAIPFLGTVLLLPVFVFQRSYSVHYLAQFGREFEVITAA